MSTPNRRMIYVAGPFAGDVEANVRRAVALGELAAKSGGAPFVPHVLGRAGVYGGTHDEAVQGVRETALSCGVAGAYFVGASRGLLYVILRDDGTPSEGTQLEINAFVDGIVDRFGALVAAASDPALFMTKLRWPEWCEALRQAKITPPP